MLQVIYMLRLLVEFEEGKLQLKEEIQLQFLHNCCNLNVIVTQM